MKKTFLPLFFFLAFLSISFSSKAQRLEFSANWRPAGTAFFSMNSSNGQLRYMLDYGDDRGKWKEYGNTLETTKEQYLFAATTRSMGTAFFALNKTTGQMFYMLDYEVNAGKWLKYGGTISGKANAVYTFKVNDRGIGSAFFCQDVSSGQVYYMLDYGTDPGVWAPFGTGIGK
jgi:hypothetical protein